jgi:DNA polymerase III epsilon subunit family exonuclease
VAFDTETTGLIPVQERVIELSAVKFTLDSSDYESFDELIDPGFPIPESSSKINGITDKDVRGKPGIREILLKFAEFIGDDAILLAHNSEFDVNFLGASFYQEGLEFPENEVWDTLGICRAFVNNVRDNKLETLVRHYGIRVNSFHRALMDSVYVMEVFKKTLNICHDLEELRKAASIRSFEAVRNDIFAVQLPLPLLKLRKLIGRYKMIKFNYRYPNGDNAVVKALPKILFKADKVPSLLAAELGSDRPETFELSRLSTPTEIES